MILVSEMSCILNDVQLWQLSQLLPARARFNKLELLFATSNRGFSLKSLYRSMAESEVEIRGTLLVIKDFDQQVFGAILNCPIVARNNFYGNGESLLFSFCEDFRVFPWTGKNNLIVKSDLESIAIGASYGKYGLWMDSEFLRGRSEQCATFDNDSLTLHEDFMISDVEVWVALV